MTRSPVNTITRLLIIASLLLLLIPAASASDNVDITVQLQKNGIPQPGAVITVDGIGSRTTDATGRISLYVAANQTINMSWETHTHLLQIQPYKYDYAWPVWSQPDHASYEMDIQIVGDTAYIYFSDTSYRINRVTVNLLTIDGSYQDTISVNASTMNTYFTGFPANEIYIVEILTYTGPDRDIPDLRHRQVLAKPGAWGVRELPVSADLMQFLMIMVVITLIGATSYLAGPQGALIGSIAAMGFWALGLLSIPMPVLAAAIVVSAIGVLIRGGKDL